FSPFTTMTYGLKGGVIGSTSPGVFFFYASYTVGSGVTTLTVDAAERFNSATGSLSNDWVVQNGQAFLYSIVNGTCTVLPATVSINGGQVSISYSPAGGVPAGTYILGIKYTNSPALIGSAPCGGTAATCKYYFIPSRSGTELTSRAQFFTF